MASHRLQLIQPKRRLSSGERPPYSAIQMQIGQELRERLDVPEGLPHQLLTLLMQMNEKARGE